MATKKVAVVTGSNQGIGLAIVRGLCKTWDGDVILTSRDMDRGKKAVEDLGKEGCQPKLHQLDITDHPSVVKLQAFLQENYGGLDVLVNNAGTAYKVSSTAPFDEQAEVSMKTNFLATLDLCEALFPLLRPHARVVNVSSMACTMTMKKMTDEIKSSFISCKDMNTLKSLMNEFVAATKAGNHAECGWPSSAYGMSKVAVTIMTNLQHTALSKGDKKDIVINSCCPGYVSTNMSSYKGTKTPDQGAETPLYLALLPANSDVPNGEFLSDKKVIPWY